MHAGGWQHRETDSRKPNQRRQASELRCPAREDVDAVAHLSREAAETEGRRNVLPA